MTFVESACSMVLSNVRSMKENQALAAPFHLSKKELLEIEIVCLLELFAFLSC